MACVALVMTIQSTGTISEDPTSTPPVLSRGISVNKTVKSIGDRDDTEDRSCIQVVHDSKPRIELGPYPQQNIERTEADSNSLLYPSPSSSGRPSHGKSILPPVLLKCDTKPTIAEHDDGWRIRSRYLHCLGMDEQIQHHDHPKSSPLTRSAQHPNPSSSHSILNSNCSVGCESTMTTLDLNSSLKPPPMTMVPLKDDHGNHDDTIRARLKSINGNREEWDDRTLIPLHPCKMGDKKKGDSVQKDDSDFDAITCKVSFSPIVQVREIPSHYSYSERIKKTIWMLPCESAESVTKNVIEFMSEGYEPEAVLDESDFVERDGELVHPVCLLLEEPENVRLKQMYYGFTPKPSTKADRSLRHISTAL